MSAIIPMGAVRSESASEYPLSLEQAALWFVTRMAPFNPVYNLVGAARFPVAVDPDAFERTIRQISSRHAVLRTTFLERRGEPIQRVHAALEPDFKFVDARSWTEDEFREHMLAECRRPFDLETGPPVRTSLYARGREDYVGLTVIHHLVSDLWSLALYVYELDGLYGANAGLRPTRLFDPGATYADFVQAEDRMLASAEGERLRDYWRRRLSGMPPSLKLPADFTRPAVPSFAGGMRSLALSPGLTAGLSSLASRSHITLAALCASAFQVFLHRYCSQQDVIVLFPRANRPPGFEHAFGYFVNPVALRADLSGNPRFCEFLARNGRNTKEDLAHGRFPLAAVAEWARAPVSQVAFTWQKTTSIVSPEIARFAAARAGGSLPLKSLPMQSVELDTGVSQFDLAVQMGGLSRNGGAGSDSLSLTLTYSSDLFRAGTAARMIANFATMLESIAEDPQARLSDLRILSRPERAAIASRWKRGAAITEEAHTLDATTLGESPAAANDAAHAALVCGDAVLTYGELQARVSALAAELRRHGVGPESTVAVCAPRGLAMIVAVVAVLEAGGAFVPLDPASPPDRIAFILRDASVRLVLTGSTIKPRLGGFDGPVICLDSFPQDAAQQPKPATPPAEQLAYVIYTSGSTGEPKGVGINRGEFVRHCRSMASYYTLSSRDRVLQFASLSFDAALEQIFTALMSRATLFVRPETIWPPREFHDFLVMNRLTVINLPPAYWQEWIQEWSRQSWPAPEALRLVIIGGDVIPAESVRLWRRTAPGSIRLLNAYGPTETTITALTHEISPGWAEESSRMPIGTALPQRCAYTLDAVGEPVPFGVAGELCLGGAGLARGYLNRPDLTAEKFVPDPHGSVGGARLYRTGDLARCRDDGAIEYMGRLDQQVKIRGFRIELGEVEEALAGHPAVRQAVAAVADSPSGKQLCAYVVADRWNGELKRELRSLLSRTLPDYMVPAFFFPLDAMPLTPGGKIDRRALPAPGPQPEAAETEPPRTALEKSLAEVWREVLGLERVGVHENFFEIGGHSLAAIRVISRLRDRFGINLPLSSFFERPTVAGLCLALAEASLAGMSPGEAEKLLAEVEGNS